MRLELLKVELRPLGGGDGECFDCFVEDLDGDLEDSLFLDGAGASVILFICANRSSFFCFFSFDTI